MSLFVSFTRPLISLAFSFASSLAMLLFPCAFIHRPYHRALLSIYSFSRVFFLLAAPHLFSPFYSPSCPFFLRIEEARERVFDSNGRVRLACSARRPRIYPPQRTAFPKENGVERKTRDYSAGNCSTVTTKQGDGKGPRIDAQNLSARLLVVDCQLIVYGAVLSSEKMRVPFLYTVQA